MTKKTLLALLIALLAPASAQAQTQERRPFPQLVPDTRGVPIEGLDLVLDDIGYPRDRTALFVMTLRNGRIESEREIATAFEQRPVLRSYRDGTDYDCLLAAMPSLQPGHVTIATAGNCREGSSKLYRRKGREFAALSAVTAVGGIGFTALGVAVGSETGFSGAGGTLGAISLGLGVAGLAETGLFIGFSSGMFRTAKRIDRGTF